MAIHSQVVNCSLHTGGFDDYHSSLNCQRKDCTEVKRITYSSKKECLKESMYTLECLHNNTYLSPRLLK